jgi:hypothetical protein
VPQSPFASPENSRQRWQFSIRGMLLFTISVAIGASVSQINIAYWLTIFAVPQTNFRQPVEVIKTGFGGGFLTVAIFWFCLGLFYQIRDIFACLKSSPAIDKNQRAGGQIEIFWRVGVIALLLSYLLVLFLIDMRILILPESGDHVWKMGTMLREAVLLLLLMMIVGSVPAANRFRLPAIFRQMIRGAFFALAIFYVSKIITYVLVTIATWGYDTASSLEFSTCGPRFFVSTLKLFSGWSFVSAFIVLLNVFFLRRLARQWTAGVGRRVIWSVLLILGIAENAAYVIWTMTIGYPTISPYLAETGGPMMGHSWIALVVLAAILSGIAAYRLSVERNGKIKATELAWRLNPHKYYHERRPILLFLAAAILWILADIYFEARRNPSIPLTAVGNIFFARWFVFSYWNLLQNLFFFLIPVFFLWVSLFLLTLHRAASRRFDPLQFPGGLTCIDRAKFITIWLATLALMSIGALAWIWSNFGLWFNPWFGGR